MRHAVQRRDRSNAPALTLHDGSTANAARPLQRPGLMGLPPATWPIRSAPLPPGTWRETVSQSRRLRIRHRDPLPRRPWSPTVCVRARASVCVCHCVRLLVPPTVREHAAPRHRILQQARGCQVAVGERGQSQCAHQSESAPQHICVHIL